MFKVNNKDTRTTPGIVLVFLLVNLNVFHTLITLNMYLQVGKNISTGLDQLSGTYHNLILIGDFNVKWEEGNISSFLNIYNLNNLVKQKSML